MHQTITCKLKSSEKDLTRQFYPQNCDFAIFLPLFLKNLNVGIPGPYLMEEIGVPRVNHTLFRTCYAMQSL